MDLLLDSRGYVRQRESQTLEFKQTFRVGDTDLLRYAKTMAGMANNQGGEIVFGIKDRPHQPMGLRDDRMMTFDRRNMNRVLLDYFAPDFHWEHDTVELFGVTLGFITVWSAPTKPVVCTRHHDQAKLREGGIYYRYRAETRDVRYAELNAILQAERDKEKQLWMNHIQTIATVGPQAAQIIDTVRGEADIQGTKVIIDRALLDQIQFVREGQFVERGGAPTLTLAGSISGLLDHDHAVYTEMAYPYTRDMVMQELGVLNRYSTDALISYFDAKGNPRYHAEIRTGKTAKVHKYSEQFLRMLRHELRADPGLEFRAREQHGGRRA
ncbi:putative DNA binding domain-containing protein [bacterium]|nr:putative DNA binding domain-containing protein [bacterium]